MPAFEDDVWELYGPDDWTQARNLAAEQPDKLAELQERFMSEARKYNVLPLDDRRFERFNPDLAGRPQLVRGTSQLLFGQMGRLSENSIVATKNKSHSLTSEILVPDGGAEGVIISQGGAFGGFVLYLKEGKPAYCYNLFGLQRFKTYGEEKVPPGEHQVRMEFAYDGGGLGKGGNVSLYLDGEQVGTGRVDATVPMLFSADETTDVGSDTASPVSDDYTPAESLFTGEVRWVQIDIGESAEDLDHLISPEERLTIAMARQ
jgi:arylsulfatase